jgi:hypothetical protein
MRVQSPGIALPRRAVAMAVDAHDFAPLDFHAESFHAHAVTPQLGDVPELLADVVELEDARVRYAAVRTAGGGEEVLDVGACLKPAAALGGTRLLAVQLPSRPEVLAKAAPAPPLETVGAAIEVGCRKPAIAPSASALHRMRRRRRSSFHRFGRVLTERIWGRLHAWHGDIPDPGAD